MAAVYITDALRLLQSLLASSGHFVGRVIIGLPSSPPETPAAAIFLARGAANLLSATTFYRQRDVTVRIYTNVIEEPRDEAEIALDEMVYDTEQALRDDLNLSATGWVVLGDIAVDYDYADVGGRGFRIADITLSLTYAA